MKVVVLWEPHASYVSVNEKENADTAYEWSILYALIAVGFSISEITLLFSPRLEKSAGD